MIDLFNRDTISQPLTQPTQDTADTKDAKPLYNPIASQKEAEAQHRAVYAAHQDAIHKAGQCRADINKGILRIRQNGR